MLWLPDEPEEWRLVSSGPDGAEGFAMPCSFQARPDDAGCRSWVISDYGLLQHARPRGGRMRVDPIRSCEGACSPAPRCAWLSFGSERRMTPRPTPTPACRRLGSGG